MKYDEVVALKGELFKMADMFNFVRALIASGHNKEACELLSVVKDKEKVASVKRAYPDLPPEVEAWLQEQMRGYHTYIDELAQQDGWSSQKITQYHQYFDYFFEGITEDVVEENAPAGMGVSQEGVGMGQEELLRLLLEREDEIKNMFDQSWDESKLAVPETPTPEELEQWYTTSKQLINTLIREGHTEEARQIIAIWPFGKKEEEEEEEAPEKPDVWQRIKGLPHEVQMRVLDKAKEEHWGRRMEQHPTEDDLWNALNAIQGPDVEAKKKKK